MRGHFKLRPHHQANLSELAEVMKEHKVYEKMSQKECERDRSKASHYREELRNMIIEAKLGTGLKC